MYITFDTVKDDIGVIRFDAYGNDAIDGDFAIWGIVYHLGEVVEKDLKKDRD